MPTVAIIATLDTKGPEVAYLRGRLRALGVGTIVIDSGILGEPVGIVPDVGHAELAARGGMTLEALQKLGTRGRAVETVRQLVSDLVRELYAEGRIAGGISVGGVGSVMRAAALQTMPVGAPKIVVAPTASGHHEFGPYVGTKDVMVVHSIVDILGLKPIATTVFDNVAAAMKGMLDGGHVLPPVGLGSRYVATTMLGNTTAAVGAMRERLHDHGFEAVVFHSNGVGGPAMEELAEAGQFVAVIDYTTNEITDPLTGGIHNGGPDRLRRVGRAGVPQIVVPGCVDFSVFAAGPIPAALRDRPMYDHNPEYTLVRSTPEEMRAIAAIFAKRLNESSAPVQVVLPAGGLSIPNTPDGPFWNPEADAFFRDDVVRLLRPDIPVQVVDLHINDPELGRLCADLLPALLKKEALL